MKTRPLLRTVICVYLFIFGFSAVVFGQDVRVLLTRQKRPYFLDIKGGFTFKDSKSQKVILEASNKRGYINFDRGDVVWLGKRFKTDTLEIIPDEGAKLYLGEQHLLGKLLVTNNKKGKPVFVNAIGIEDYLKGVLPEEMPFWWPLESLKAQAIAARTYTLYHIGENKDRNYDVLDTALSQVYGGKSSQRFKTDMAVWITRGLILNFRGNLFSTYYHSCCGGRTESGEYFDKDEECLSSKPCPFCKGTKFYRWSKKVKKSTFIANLNKKGYCLSDIKSIAIKDRTVSGRAKSLAITKETGSVFNILSKDLRFFLGGNNLLSNFYEVSVKGEYIYFSGKGWGHGVGMCQWGAYNMARKGYNYKEILDFYYPGAELVRIDED